MKGLFLRDEHAIFKCQDAGIEKSIDKSKLSIICCFQFSMSLTLTISLSIITIWSKSVSSKNICNCFFSF